MAIETGNLIDRFFSIETWERLDWLNKKWNKTKEEKADIVKSAGVFPLIVMSLIMLDWISGAIIFNISNNTMSRMVTGVGCVWLFIAIYATHHLPSYIRTSVILISLGFMLVIPAILLFATLY